MPRRGYVLAFPAAVRVVPCVSGAAWLLGGWLLGEGRAEGERGGGDREERDRGVRRGGGSGRRA